MSSDKKPGKEFREVVDLLSKFIENKKAFILLTPPYFLEFAIPGKNDLHKKLVDLGLRKPLFNFHRKIAAELLLGIVSRHEEAAIRSQANAISEETEGGDEESPYAGLTGKDEIESELRDQLEYIRKKLYSDHIQRRYDLKRSSKAPAFNNVDWDVKIKVYDSDHDGIEKYPYATLKIGYQRDFEENPYSLLGGRTFDSLQVNFSGDEIEYLSKILNSILTVLRSQEQYSQS